MCIRDRHSLGCGVEDVNVTAQVARNHHRTSGIEDAAVQPGNALELALSLAFTQRGAEARKGDGDQKRLRQRPETGEPENPRTTLGRRAAIASQDDRAGKGKCQSDHEGSCNSPGVVGSGHN